MNRKHVNSSILTLDDTVPCELTYRTTKAEAASIIAERHRNTRIIADQGVWLTAFLQLAGGWIEFSPEDMEAAGARLVQGPLHVARSREGGIRISLEPFDAEHAAVPSGGAVVGNGDDRPAEAVSGVVDGSEEAGPGVPAGPDSDAGEDRCDDANVTPVTEASDEPERSADPK